MRKTMKVCLMVFASIVVAVVAQFFDIPASRASGDAPWCAVVSLGTGGVYWDCQYRTIEDCVPNVLSGNRGSCNHNPWYVPKTAAPQKYRTRHSQQN